MTNVKPRSLSLFAFPQRFTISILFIPNFYATSFCPRSIKSYHHCSLPFSLPQFLGLLLAPSLLPLPFPLLAKVFLVASFLSLVLVSPSNFKSHDECQTKIPESLRPFPKDLLYLLYLFVLFLCSIILSEVNKELPSLQRRRLFYHMIRLLTFLADQHFMSFNPNWHEL